jgi:transposase-like protein
LMQAALKAEVTEFLGRERYQRSTSCPDASAGSRNGYRPVTVKTTTGAVTLERPKLRGTRKRSRRVLYRRSRRLAATGSIGGM